MIRSEQETIRLGSLQQIKDLGINPFPAEEFIISHRSNELSENFEVDKEITMAGEKTP